MFDLRDARVWVEFDKVAAPTRKYEDGESHTADSSSKTWVEVKKAAGFSICVDTPTTLLLPDWDALACTLTLDGCIAFTWQLSWRDLCRFKPYRISHVYIMQPSTSLPKQIRHKLRILDAGAADIYLPDVEADPRATTSKSARPTFAEQLGCVKLELHRVKFANLDRHQMHTTVMHVDKFKPYHNSDLIKKTKAWQISLAKGTTCHSKLDTRPQMRAKESEAGAIWHFYYRSTGQLPETRASASVSEATGAAGGLKKPPQRTSLPLSDESLACAGASMQASTSDTGNGNNSALLQQTDASESMDMSISECSSTRPSLPPHPAEFSMSTTSNPPTFDIPAIPTGPAIEFPEITARDRLDLWLISADLTATATRSEKRNIFIAFSKLPSHRHFTPSQWRVAWEQTIHADWNECRVQAGDKQNLFQHADTIEHLDWEGRWAFWKTLVELDTYEHLTAKQWELFWMQLVRPVWILDRDRAQRQDVEEGLEEGQVDEAAVEGQAVQAEAAQKNPSEKKAADELAAAKRASDVNPAETDEMEGVEVENDVRTDVCTPTQPTVNASSPLLFPNSSTSAATLGSRYPRSPFPLTRTGPSLPTDVPQHAPTVPTVSAPSQLSSASKSMVEPAAIPSHTLLDGPQRAPTAPMASAPSQLSRASTTAIKPAAMLEPTPFNQPVSKSTQPKTSRSILRPSSRLPAVNRQAPAMPYPAMPTPERPYISAHCEAFTSKDISKNSFIRIIDTVTHNAWRDLSNNESEKKEFADCRAALSEEEKADILWDRAAMARVDAMLGATPEEVGPRNARWEERDLWCWWWAKRSNDLKVEKARRKEHSRASSRHVRRG